MARYFAYGSNMETSQMALRVPGAHPLARGRLAGFRFRCNKIGRDGSAKANLEVADGAEVWGVVFDLPPDGFRSLDPFEGGYRRRSVEVEIEVGSLVWCEVYVSDQTSTTLLPTRAYRDRMARGAIEHGLPKDYCAAVRDLAVCH